jgi:hypothetical protein
MFAVILLGIGFIMLAGMFPVAIRQTQTTAEESHGAILAQAGAKILEQVALAKEYPVTDGQVRGLTKEAWLRLDGNLVNAQDPRFAWTALYKRNAGENFIQVVILAARSNLRPAFDANDTSALNMPLAADPGLDVPNLYPRRLGSATLKKGDAVNGIADRITFSQVEPMLASGSFIVCGNNNDAVRVYRLGNEFVKGKDYDLDPAYGMEPNDPATVSQAVVWSLGMSETAPKSRQYEGLTMDVAAYVTFVMLK